MGTWKLRGRGRRVLGRRRRLVGGRPLLRAGAGAAVALGVLGLGSVLVLPSLSPATPVGSATVSDVSDQTIQGFGASGAWWPQDLQHFGPATRQQVASMLFDPSGLYLSQYRYNIGGGGVGVTTPAKAPPTFLVSPGNYDWSADPAGLMFLQTAVQHGVPTLVGFVNSAPPAWTTDHKSCGGSLRPGSESAYAAYLSAVVAHLHNVEHITLSYVSPMNEPDSSQHTCRQEGMAVPVDERAPLVKDLASDLAKQAPYARVIADESSTVATQLLPEAPRWLSVPGAASAMAAIAHHTYDYPPIPVLQQVAQLGRQFHKPTWASEICCRNEHGFGYQYDPTIASGLWLANTIWADLTQAHDSAFDWWTALSPRLGCSPVADPACPARMNPVGRNDGLLYYYTGSGVGQDQTIYTTKRYWALGNFSRYVRPGAVLHEVTDTPPGTRAAAFDSNGRWSIVVMNSSPVSTPSVPLTLRIPTRGRALSPSTAVETSATRDLEPVALPVYRAGTMTATVPAQSVTTFVLQPGQSRARATTAAESARGHRSGGSNDPGNGVRTERAART